jgi:hypothetical protein
MGQDFSARFSYARKELNEPSDSGMYRSAASPQRLQEKSLNAA